MKWTPEELAVAAGGRLLRRGASSVATAFIDSREPVAGGLFVPIVAARDGHDFIPAAIEAGAAAILCAPGRAPAQGQVTVVEVEDTLAALTALARARRSLVQGPVVSISGSNGKTTTRSMVDAALSTAFDPVLCTRGNLNNHLGVPLTLLAEPHEPAAMVVELGMNAPGENDHLASIVEPSVHVVTSIALEHLEFMKTIEAIAAAEAEPFAHVPDDGAVVVPSDEPLLTPHLRGGATVLRVGPDDDADVRVVSAALGGASAATVATLQPRGRDAIDVRLKLFGEHNARNAAAALGVGIHLGLPVAPMVAALESVEPVGDRGRVIQAGQRMLIADCYNSNPGSVDAALRSLAALPQLRVAVLGDMLELGPRGESLHADVGRLAAGLGIDVIVGVGPQSRALVEAAPGAKHFGSDEIQAAAQWLAQRIADRPAAILVKASRGMKLERMIDELESVWALERNPA